MEGKGLIKEKCIAGKEYQICLECKEQSAWIENGYFGEISIEKSALFCAKVKNIDTGEYKNIYSDSAWENVRVNRHGDTIKLYFTNPEGISKLLFVVSGIYDEVGISWSVEVINDNCKWSVIEVNYPIPLLRASYFDLFVPDGSGIVIENAGKNGYSSQHRYPGGFICMQYYAVYGKNSGIYIGVEDGEGAVKNFKASAGDEQAVIEATFYGINSSAPANSFSLGGHIRWQFIEGDWYDATMLYADFVRTKANWMPHIEQDGRTDTPERFKNVPFWVSDYIPNSPSQGNNKPMKLSAGSDLYDKNYWVDAVIELQEKLQVPIAYHVYNWHKIPFNIEYPHFLPAKEDFIEGAKKLREHPIYILPYINAGSWEMHDAEMGHEINFENTGKRGAIIQENGDFDIEIYPQKTLKGVLL